MRAVPERTVLRTLQWRTLLDNYEPPRTTVFGVATVYAPTDVAPETIVLDAVDLPEDSHQATYLLDDGNTVTVWYVAGWRQDEPTLFLHPFPVNPEGRTRPDNGRVVDYSTWQRGPRRAYHLKVTTTTEVAS